MCLVPRFIRNALEHRRKARAMERILRRQLVSVADQYNKTLRAYDEHSRRVSEAMERVSHD